MATDLTLLPPNATQAERDIETAMRASDGLRTAIDLIRTAKENPPDDFLMWLVYEYGLAELLPYLTDLRVVISDGLAWQRIRGTPDSLRLAFPWIGLNDVTIEEEDAKSRHWFEYQLDTGQVLQPAEIFRLFGLATISAPVGTRLYRMFHGYDFRQAYWDIASWDEGSLWDADSGVIDPDTGAVISFGVTWISSVNLTDDGDITTALVVEIELLSNVTYIDHEILDITEYDDDIVVDDYPVVCLRLVEMLGQGVGRNIRVLDGKEKLDGSKKLNNYTRTEVDQYPAIIDFVDYSFELHGWSLSSGWSSSRTWTT